MNDLKGASELMNAGNAVNHSFHSLKFHGRHKKTLNLQERRGEAYPAISGRGDRVRLARKRQRFLMTRAALDPVHLGIGTQNKGNQGVLYYSW